MRPLRVAVLDEELPFPPTSGKRIRTFNLLRRLADRHRVTLLCHKNPDPDEAAAADDAFRRLGVETVVVDRAVPPKAGPGFYARLAGNLLSPLPYSVESHASPALAAAARIHARDNPPDVWHCEWTPYAEVLRDALGDDLAAARWTVMAHNVESLIWKRYAGAEPNPVKRWYVARQGHKFERFERWAYTAATTAIAVSPDDAALMREWFGVTSPAVVENGVDTDYFRPQRDVDRDPARILFLGSLDWRPNLDGVRLLLDDIFPKVQAAVPHATLALVGRHPPDWLRTRAAETPGVELSADVPDVRPFLATCGMLAVPLRIGGGVAVEDSRSPGGRNAGGQHPGRGRGAGTRPRPRLHPDRRHRRHGRRGRDRHPPPGRTPRDRRTRPGNRPREVRLEPARRQTRRRLEGGGRGSPDTSSPRPGQGSDDRAITNGNRA